METLQLGIIAFLLTLIIQIASASWHESSWNTAWDTWWHYKEGVIGGPTHWGHTAHMAYAEDIWPACHLGRLQSPINIISSSLIYDINLQPLHIYAFDKQIDLDVYNAGQDLRIEVVDSSLPVYFRGGPLSYEYRLFGAHLKFGSSSERGSDHQVDGIAFPAEIQFYSYNSVLHSNFSAAVAQPNGLAAISIFLQIGENPSADLSALFAISEDLKLQGQSRRLNGLMLSALFPSTKQYLTYQGSLPFPGCHETVTWIILNEAVVVTETQLKALRDLRIAPFEQSGLMANNYRPVQSLNNRSVRTNIDFGDKSQCPMQPRISYVATLPRKFDHPSR